MTLSILVTGATGFIGRDLVRRLAAAGHQVRAASRDPAALEGFPVEPVRMGDLSAGGTDWRRLVDGMTHVVHLAGIAHASAAIPDAVYDRVNAQAVGDLATAARVAAVRRIVFVSSVRAQTGPAAPGVLDERGPEAPTDAYGRSKLAGERALAAVLADGTTDWVALRPVVLYGAGVKGNVRALMRIARTPLPLPVGGLAGRRSLLGLGTFASAVGHVLEAESASRRVFLVADPGPVTIGDLVTALRRGCGRPPRLVAVPERLIRAGARLVGKGAMLDRLAGDLVVDTTALQATGWCPSETARDGLARWARGG